VPARLLGGGNPRRAPLAALREAGVTAVYTPKDYELPQMMADMAELVAAHRAGTATLEKSGA
jgi:methylmalonyl-CoA mutase cobalamin-binding subunit